MTKLNLSLPGSRQHFELLDGLRGIAALAIVLFHFMEIIFADPTQNFIGHGFLAVDFFFCLSGFVIPYAYDQRVNKMSTWEFFKIRLIRLHPLVVFGAVLGLLAFFLDPFADPFTYSAGKIFLIFLASVFLIPLPVMADRFFNLFGLNAPAWSLFWEYVANILYALVLHKLPRAVLVVLLVLAAAVLCFVSHRAGGSLLGGWSGDTFWDGGARIAYSFLAGMVIYRFNLIIKTKLGFLGLSALLFLAFLLPFNSWNWLTELLVVMIYFPLLLSLGAGGRQASSTKKLCDFSGKISYPLYMTHYAAMFIFLHYFTKYTPGTAGLLAIIFCGMLILTGFAYLVMKYYDTPLRKYLTERRMRR